MPRLLTLLLLVTALVAGGCDYSIVESEPGTPTGPGGGATSVSIVVTPGVATVQPGRTLQLRAVVTGAADTSATWSIVSGPGRIYPDGLFVAPADSTGTTTVRARSVADGTKTASATITISRDSSGGERVVVGVTPASVTILAGTQQQFTATVTGSTNTSVSWSLVAGGVGTISPTGIYSAPATVSNAPVVVTIQAVSLADAAAIGRATVTLTVPVDPNRICFDREILPLFRSNCASSGCHDSKTREHGYDFATAADIRREIVPGNSHEGDIMEAIVGKREDDGRIDLEDIMPPPPRDQLSAAQIDLIRRWIEAGADTTSCPPPAGACDTSDVRWSTTVRPVLVANCAGCHNSSYASGNVDLSSHAGTLVVARNGKLYGSITHAAGFKAMPYGGGKLDDCTIAKIGAWIARGAPEN